MVTLVRAHEKLALNIICLQEFDLEPNFLTRTLEFDAIKRNLSQPYLANLGPSINTFYRLVVKILTNEKLAFETIPHLNVY